MKEVLEKFFGSFYGSTKTVEVISEQKTGVFERADDKACAGCRVTQNLSSKAVTKRFSDVMLANRMWKSSNWSFSWQTIMG